MMTADVCVCCRPRARVEGSSKHPKYNETRDLQCRSSTYFFIMTSALFFWSAGGHPTDPFLQIQVVSYGTGSIDFKTARIGRPRGSPPISVVSLSSATLATRQTSDSPVPSLMAPWMTPLVIQIFGRAWFINYAQGILTIQKTARRNLETKHPVHSLYIYVEQHAYQERESLVARYKPSPTREMLEPGIERKRNVTSTKSVAG